MFHEHEVEITPMIHGMKYLDVKTIVCAILIIYFHVQFISFYVNHNSGPAIFVATIARGHSSYKAMVTKNNLYIVIFIIPPKS